MRYSQPLCLARARDQIVTEALVPRVDRHADQGKRDRRALPEDVQDLEQRPAVLASGQAHHDPIAVLDQAVVGYRLGDFLGEARFERSTCRT